MKKIFKEAHKMTREMVEKYGVDYKGQFAICLSYLLNKEEEEMNGTEKQIEYANIIKERLIDQLRFSKASLNSLNRKNFLLGFKEPLMKDYGKNITIKEAEKAVTIYIDTAIKNIREEKSAKKLIDIYNAPMYTEKTIYEAIVKFFI